MIYLYHPPPPWSDRREECSQRGTNSPEKDHQPDLLAWLGEGPFTDWSSSNYWTVQLFGPHTAFNGPFDPQAKLKTTLNETFNLKNPKRRNPLDNALN